MSRARFSEDGKEVLIECNYGRKVAFFILKHLDKNPEIETDNDRIMLKYQIRDVSDINSQLYVDNHIIIKKEYTAVLSHVFRTIADVMDDWYKKDSKDE